MQKTGNGVLSTHLLSFHHVLSIWNFQPSPWIANEAISYLPSLDLLAPAHPPNVQWRLI